MSLEKAGLGYKVEASAPKDRMGEYTSLWKRLTLSCRNYELSDQVCI